jgi:hypothetical protein
VPSIGIYGRASDVPVDMLRRLKTEVFAATCTIGLLRGAEELVAFSHLGLMSREPEWRASLGSSCLSPI